ncbi:MAG: FG-GAP repeat protein [Planctomycetota bacterium]
MIGDVNRDGYSDVAVGAPYENISAAQVERGRSESGVSVQAALARWFDARGAGSVDVDREAGSVDPAASGESDDLRAHHALRARWVPTTESLRRPRRGGSWWGPRSSNTVASSRFPRCLPVSIQSGGAE